MDRTLPETEGYLVDVGERQERQHDSLVAHVELAKVTIGGLRERAVGDDDTCAHSV